MMMLTDILGPLDRGGIRGPFWASNTDDEVFHGVSSSSKGWQEEQIHALFWHKRMAGKV